MYKFQFLDLVAEPTIEDGLLTIRVSKVLEIVSPKPYRVIEEPQVLSFEVEYADSNELLEALKEVIALQKAEPQTFEDELESVLSKYSFIKEFSQFDRTRIKSMDEKVIIQDCRVQYIKPMVSIEGLVCMTNERIYF